jgi:hypothetical protein
MSRWAKGTTGNVSTPKKTPASAGSSLAGSGTRAGNGNETILRASSMTRANNSKEPVEFWALYESEANAIRMALQAANCRVEFEHSTTLSGASTGLKTRTAGASA